MLYLILYLVLSQLLELLFEKYWFLGREQISVVEPKLINKNISLIFGDLASNLISHFISLRFLFGINVNIKGAFKANDRLSQKSF